LYFTNVVINRTGWSVMNITAHQQ